MSGLMPPGPLSYNGQVAVPYINRTFAPTSSDIEFNVPTVWTDTNAGASYILTSKALGISTWQPIGGGAVAVEFLEGNTGGEVPPIAGLVIVKGDGTTITAAGTPGAGTLVFSVIPPLTQAFGGTGTITATAHGVAVGQDLAAFTYIPPSSTVGYPLVSTGNTTDPAYTGTASVTQITISNAPANPTDGVNKQYADTVGAGFTFKTVCVAGTVANLTATYANMAGGVGATLTNAGTQIQFAIDGVTPATNARVLIKNQTTTFQNGIYTVTTQGSGSTNWVLTRSTDFNSAATMPEGSFVPVSGGTVNSATTWILVAPVTTVGTDPVLFDLFGGTELAVTQGTVYSNGTGTLSGIDAGTAGRVLTSNGTGVAPSFQTPGAGAALINVQTFTTSGTYTPNARLAQCIIEVLGGGGGGGSIAAAPSSGAGGGGGGAGGYSKGVFSAATIGASQIVTIGIGGAGGANTGGNPGVTGGTSSTGSIISATGGIGGQGDNGGTTTYPIGGAGGTGSGGFLNIPGSQGGNLYANPGFDAVTGSVNNYGAASIFGSQVFTAPLTGLNQALPGADAIGYGCGGSGAISTATSGPSLRGGNGSPGIIIITEYLT